MSDRSVRECWYLLKLSSSLIGLVKGPHPEPMPPELILNKVSPEIGVVNKSLASVKTVTPPIETIPYIFPVVSLLEVLPKKPNVGVRLLLQRPCISLVYQQVVQQHRERWDVVNDKLRKVTRLVDGVVTTCASNNLEENDLPRNLPTIFQSLESYVMHS